MKFVVVPPNTAAILGFIGPSEFHPGGRRTLVLLFFRELLSHDEWQL